MRNRAIVTALRIALFVLAAWALQREMRGLHGDALLRSLLSYGPRRLTLAFSCTVASFVALGGIEILALRYTGFSRVVPCGAALVTAFVAHAFSQSVGLALLTGAAVRLRGYSRYALDAVAIARVSTFVTLTVTLGLLVTGAGALLASSAPLPLGHASIPVRSAGLALALVVVAYVAWSALGGRDAVGHGRWRIDRPSPFLAAGQLCVSALDWLLTGTVLFALLPQSATVGYAELLRVYLIAQTVGVASHIPGGAGVFEVVVLTLVAVSGADGYAALVASLVMFRVVYYLLPLVVAGLVAAAVELLPQNDEHAARAPLTLPVRYPARPRSVHVR